MAVLVESKLRPPFDFLHNSLYTTYWCTDCAVNRSPDEVTTRLDRLITQIRSYQEPYLSSSTGKATTCGTGDIMVVGHGHILRAFAMRWVGKSLQEGPTFLMEAGGVGTLSYEHKSIHEPAILLGGAFVVENPEESIAEARKD